jgi:hypothetical protein
MNASGDIGRSRTKLARTKLARTEFLKTQTLQNPQPANHDDFSGGAK